MIRSSATRQAAAAALLLMMLVTGQVVSAQSEAGSAAGDATSVEAVALEGDVGGDEVSGELDTTPPGIFSVGLSAGFPSYQTVALNASIQSQYVGFQLKGSWTAVGP